MLAVGFAHLAVELHEHVPRHLKLPRAADIEQTVQVAETVVGRIDRVLGLTLVFGPAVVLREVREVPDNEIDGVRNGLEEVPLQHVDAVGDAVPLGILARERDGVRVRVRRPHLDVRCGHGDRDPDHTRAGADVGDAHAAGADVLQRCVHECLGCGSRGEHAAGRSEEVESVKGDFHENEAVADWAQHFQREDERYRDGEARLPDAEDADARQRQLTRMGNAAAGAGLALVMQRKDEDAHAWFDRACARYRDSWEHAPPGSWGRPVAILKARILDRDWSAAERDAAWTLEARAGEAASPIGRYAAVLAHAVLGEWEAMRVLADALRTAEGFPADVGDALAYVAAQDPVGYAEAIGSVLESFETREEYLEDLPAADTVLVLQTLAERRGLVPAELESELLPS
jgi:hypothetical protein